MSEREITSEIAELMKLTGEKDPIKALRKARKMLVGRRTTHSRVVGTFYGILDAMNVLREIEKSAYDRGVEDGYKIALSKEPEEVRKRKMSMELKLLDKLDKIFDKLDVFMDAFAMGFTKTSVTSVKQQIKEKVKVKPKFKVSIEG